MGAAQKIDENPKSEPALEISILLAISSKTSREVFNKYLLQQKNISTIPHSDPKEITKILKTRPVDIIILDEELDGKSTFSLIDSTKSEIPWTYFTKIICSGDTSQVGIAKMIEYGFKFSISKPFTSATIKSSMDDLLKAYAHPSDAFTLIRKANHLLIEKKYDDALTVIQKINDKSNLEAVYTEASILNLLNKYEEALILLKQVITTKPKFLNALNLIVEVLTKLGRMKQAHQYSMQAVEIAPDNETRIETGIDVAVRSANFKEIVTLVETVNNLEWTGQKVLKHSIAALIVQGMDEIINVNIDQAYKCFELAAIISLKNDDLIDLRKRSLMEALRINKTISLDMVIQLVAKSLANEPIDQIIRGLLAYHDGKYKECIEKLKHFQNKAEHYNYTLPALLESYKKINNQKEVDLISEIVNKHHIPTCLIKK